MDRGVEVGVVADARPAARTRPAPAAPGSPRRLARLSDARDAAPRDSASRSAPTRPAPSAISALSGGRRRSPPRRPRRRRSRPRVVRGARSSIWSPIATPPRSALVRAARRKTPNGRFWIGKSVPARWRDSTQLRSAGSWVSLSVLIGAAHGCAGSKCFVSPCQQSLVVALQLRRLRSASSVGRIAQRVSNMNAIVSVIAVGCERSRLLAFSNVSASGPCPLMQLCRTGAARHEALGLGVVHAVDQTHELARDVAVEPGRAERVLHGDQPARRKDHEVDRCRRPACRSATAAPGRSTDRDGRS